MTTGEHLSIGEVLAALVAEFPDVTVSKIRFLESQGLIDPERTPSGYRKFYPADVTRLRWILHQQKEHFLPLKVIRERLATLDDAALAADLADGPSAQPTGDTGDPPRPAAGGAPGPPQPGPAGRDRGTARRRTGSSAGTGARPGRPSRPATATPAGEPDPGIGALDTDAEDGDDLTPELSGVSLTRAELAAAAGLRTEQVDELVAYGLITAQPGPRGAARFDEDALAVAGLAARFAAHGIQARHLKMYRTFAEREATLFGQAVLGLLRQRNPEARAAARDAIAELAALGRRLRAVHLRRAVSRALRE